MRQRLGKRVVDAAVAPPRGTRYLWDSEVPGFALRVYKGKDGALRRVYIVRFTMPNGSSRWITIGRHGGPGRPDARGNPRTLTAELAREEALRFRGMWQAGENPRAQRAAGRVAGDPDPRTPCPTLEDFAKTYLDLHSDVHKAARSAEEDRGYLTRHILPALGKRRLDDIGPGEVSQLQAKLRGKPTTANRCLEVISTMVNKARLWKVLPRTHENPCADLPRFKETRRERYLTGAELARVGPALVAEQGTHPYHVAAILVLAFTGGRPVEILTLKWDQLRVDQAMVMLHRKGRWLPLYIPKPAIAVLEALAPKDGNPYVFPGANTASPVSMSRLQQLWARVRAAAGKPERVLDLVHLFGAERRQLNDRRHAQPPHLSDQAVGRDRIPTEQHTGVRNARQLFIGERERLRIVGHRSGRPFHGPAIRGSAVDPERDGDAVGRFVLHVAGVPVLDGGDTDPRVGRDLAGRQQPSSQVSKHGVDLFRGHHRLGPALSGFPLGRQLQLLPHGPVDDRLEGRARPLLFLLKRRSDFRRQCVLVTIAASGHLSSTAARIPDRVRPRQEMALDTRGCRWISCAA